MASTGFLRPSFPYKEGVRYLYSKYIECRESDNEIAQLLTDDWKVKFCSALIPRGLEDNQSYLSAERANVSVIYEVFMEEVGKDPSFAGMDLCDLLAEANDKVGASGEPWQELLDRANISADAKTKLMEKHAWIANSLDSLTQELIEYASFLRENGFRFTSYAEKQPKPVDSVIDSTSVETQGFAEGLTMSAALALRRSSCRRQPAQRRRPFRVHADRRLRYHRRGESIQEQKRRVARLVQG